LKDLWDQAGPQEAMKYAETRPFPSLYRFIAQGMLKELDLVKAHQYFTKCSDYEGIQLIKKLQKLEV
jgi:WD repeat-containing protein 35